MIYSITELGFKSKGFQPRVFLPKLKVFLKFRRTKYVLEINHYILVFQQANDLEEYMKFQFQNPSDP